MRCRDAANNAKAKEIYERGVKANLPFEDIEIPQQLALPRAGDAFDGDGSLKDKAQQEMLKGVVEALAIAARKFAKP